MFLLVSYRGFCIDLVDVPAGTLAAFWLTTQKSTSKSKTTSVLEVEAFKTMKYPVTVGQYKVFLKDNPGWSKPEVSPLFADESYLHEFENRESDKQPVTNVSWFAAQAFCQSLDMRLPTVIEWEYMAAANESEAYAYNNKEFLARILKWYGKPKSSHFPDVGSTYKNKYGLWDLHGLTWEWVSDFNSIFVTGESREDGSFNKDKFCGSGALTQSDRENYASFMRFAFRSALKGSNSAWNLGFRCVR